MTATLVERPPALTDVPCEGMFVRSDCPRPADLRVASLHTEAVFPVCLTCWEGDRTAGWCPRDGGTWETRDEHYRILERLR